MGEPHRAFGHECRRSQRVGVNAAARSCSRHRIWSCRSECALLCEGAETSTASRLSGCEGIHRSLRDKGLHGHRTSSEVSPRLFGDVSRSLSGAALNKCESQTRCKSRSSPEILGPTLRVGIPSGHPASRSSRRSALSGAGGTFAARVLSFLPVECRVSASRRTT
jgi:hypothetical protein